MEKDLWGFNVIGQSGLDANNDFAVNPTEDGSDIVIRFNGVELTGAEFAILKEMAQGGGGSGIELIQLNLEMPEDTEYFKIEDGLIPSVEELNEKFDNGELFQVRATVAIPGMGALRIDMTYGDYIVGSFETPLTGFLHTIGDGSAMIVNVPEGKLPEGAGWYFLVM